MFVTSCGMDQDNHTKNTKIYGVRVYIINGCVTRKNIDDRSRHGYFMVYADTKVVIIYLKLDQTFSIHIYHNDWFGEYNSCLSMEYNPTPGYLLF